MNKKIRAIVHEILAIPPYNLMKGRSKKVSLKLCSGEKNHDLNVYWLWSIANYTISMQLEKKMHSVFKASS